MKRYTVDVWGELRESDCGGWVRYEDADRLREYAEQRDETIKDLRFELWRLAENISPELPGWARQIAADALANNPEPAPLGNDPTGSPSALAAARLGTACTAMMRGDSPFGVTCSPAAQAALEQSEIDKEVDPLVAEVAKLKDPAVVHVNMLRGIIAPISMEQCAHVHGAEMVERWRAFEEYRLDKEPAPVIDFGERNGPARLLNLHVPRTCEKCGGSLAGCFGITVFGVRGWHKGCFPAEGVTGIFEATSGSPHHADCSKGPA